MATVTPTLTISSTDALVDTLSLSVTDTLNISGNSAFGKTKTSTADKTIYGTSYGRAMVYLKNLGTTADEFILVEFGVNNEAIKLNAGEFAIFPWDGVELINATASANNPVLEHAIFEF